MNMYKENGKDTHVDENVATTGRRKTRTGPELAEVKTFDTVYCCRLRSSSTRRITNAPPEADARKNYNGAPARTPPITRPPMKTAVPCMFLCSKIYVLACVI